MNIHHNARLTPLGRERMVRAIVEGRQMPQAAARAAGVCPRTARKWVARFKAEGLAGLADRSSRPQRLRQPTSPAVVDQVIALRRQRLSGQHIAKAAGVSPATVSRILNRAGLEHDDFSSSRHPALPLCLSMIFSENREPLFGIML